MNDEVINLLKKTNAILADSHFVGTSGRHTPTYINKDALYPHTQETSRIGELFAEKYIDQNVDVVAAPAMGGIILSTWTAYHLSKVTGKEVLGVYTEKDKDQNQVFTRGYDKLVRNKNVLVIEDLTTTGGSVKKAVTSVKNAGGKVIGVCVMVNRDPVHVTSDTIDAPFSSLAVLEVPSYAESECPLCQEGIPINITIGHGKKYLEEKQKKSS